MLKKFHLPFVISEVVLFAIYSLIVFVCFDSAKYSNGSFILGYVFTIGFALLNAVVALIAQRLCTDHTDSVNEIALFVPAEAGAYVLSFVLSFAFLLVSPKKMKAAVVIYVILLILYIAYFVFIIYVTRAQASNRKHTRRKVNFIRFLVSDVESAISKTNDSLIKEQLEKLRDDIKYSDPMSSPELSGIEEQLESLAGTLGSLIEEGKTESVSETVRQMSNLVQERNRKCRILK